jgi:hypothetical protein
VEVNGTLKARRDARRGVFNDQAARRINLQVRRSGQVHIRVRLAARHLVAAENTALKKTRSGPLA